jgi:penicillin amidase
MHRFMLFGWFVLLFASHTFAATRCEIWEDSQRIPHARVSDEISFTYCFGYLHGRDRAWMMDHLRRTALGTNSEVHGFSHLKGDMMMRLLDIPGQVDRLWAGLGDAEKTMLKSYSAGVNHGFRVNRQHPTKEFQNGHPLPEEWKPQHTLMVLLIQSFDQTRKTFWTEYEETLANERWGDKARELFDPDGLPWDTTVLKTGEYASAKAQGNKMPWNKKTEIKRLWAFFPNVFGEESGSNNWVVAPQHSATKTAILANDPHLDLKTPMFWYWMHVEGPTTDVIGATLPGVPLIVSGTNRRVSWGLTNAYVNTADVVELTASEEKELESFRPLVWVKWGFLKLPIFFKSFQRTKDGFPVLPLELKGDSRALVLRWSGFHLKGEDLASLRHMMLVRDSAEMDRTLARVGVPSWNFVFADTQGVIGHRVVGKAYRAEKKHPHGISEGTLEEVRSQKFLSPAEMPHVFNPKRGWVVTANNRHWPSDSQFYGGRSYSPGFRAGRIEELLLKKKQDVESMRELQCDIQAADAPHMVPLIVKALDTAELSIEEKVWLDDLKAWDMLATLDCKVCPIYRRTLDLSYEKLGVWEGGFWRLGQEGHADWLTATRAAFKQAHLELKGKIWRDVHLNRFPHQSGRTDWRYSPEIPTRGDKQSVDPGSMRWDEERKVFEHTAGASERLVVVMKDMPEIWLSLPGLNARYDHKEGQNPWGSWANCEQQRVEWPVSWEQKKLEKVEVEL